MSQGYLHNAFGVVKFVMFIFNVGEKKKQPQTAEATCSDKFKNEK